MAVWLLLHYVWSRGKRFEWVCGYANTQSFVKNSHDFTRSYIMTSSRDIQGVAIILALCLYRIGDGTRGIGMCNASWFWPLSPVGMCIYTPHYWWHIVVTIFLPILKICSWDARKLEHAGENSLEMFRHSLGHGQGRMRLTSVNSIHGRRPMY